MRKIENDVPAGLPIDSLPELIYKSNSD